jgi:hypothetical protein
LKNISIIFVGAFFFSPSKQPKPYTQSNQKKILHLLTFTADKAFQMLFKIDVVMSNFQIEAIKKVVKLFFYCLLLFHPSWRKIKSSISKWNCSQLEFITRVEPSVENLITQIDILTMHNSRCVTFHVSQLFLSLFCWDNFSKILFRCFQCRIYLN